MMPQLANINRLQYDAIGHSLSGGKTAAIILHNAHNISRTNILLEIVVPEWDHDRMVQVVQYFVIVPLDELFKFVFDLLFRHFL